MCLSAGTHAFSEVSRALMRQTASTQLRHLTANTGLGGKVSSTGFIL